MKEASNLPKPTFFENRVMVSFQNSFKTLKSVLLLTKKIFML